MNYDSSRSHLLDNQRGAMKIVMTLLLILSSLVLVMPTHAGESNVGLDVNSAYIWRGITVNDGLVAQPWLETVTPIGITIGVWGNMDLDDYDGAFDKGEFSEIDITVSYTLQLEGVELEAGYVEYLFPQQSDEEGALASTRELWLKAGVDLGAGFAMELEYAPDIDEVEDYYSSVGLSYSVEEIIPGLGASLASKVGYVGKDWAAAYSGGTEGGFHDWNVSLQITCAVSEDLELTGSLINTGSMNKDVLPEQDVETYGGLSAAYSF